MNKTTTLALLVKEWLKSHPAKEQWKFEFQPLVLGNFNPPDLNRGRLEHQEGIRRMICIEGNEAWIGSELGGSDYAAVKINAADPCFFVKLDRLMQFATTISKRQSKYWSEFIKSEQDFLREHLK